jgi:hypothetical protein
MSPTLYEDAFFGCVLRRERRRDVPALSVIVKHALLCFVNGCDSIEVSSFEGRGGGFCDRRFSSKYTSYVINSTADT